MKPEGFPLQWPVGWPRTRPGDRRVSGFGTTRNSSIGRKTAITMGVAVERVYTVLDRMGIGDWNIIISTNIPINRKGVPYSGQKTPDDVGAAVYWKNGDKHRVMAIDCYTTVEDNIAAIAATLEALRSVERHGGGVIGARAFTGFDALPAPSTDARTWREVLGNCKNRQEVRDAYRVGASIHHPDKGGSDARMAALNRARDEALAELTT